MDTQTSFIIPRDGYLTFDALSFKKFIKDRLNETAIFTDQNYEGSYINTIIEILGYFSHVLLYYLNQTSTESVFSEAQIYENINRIVKLIDYKPIGKQTSILSFIMKVAANIFSPGLYTIPRYSYLNFGDKSYSFNEDVVFTKTLSIEQAEVLTTISNEKLLYQGMFVEYPTYSAIGNDNEIIYFAPGNNILIDHFNIDVYVKNSYGLWKKWNRTFSLYLNDAFSEVYEIRLNENKRYEIKFGNGINGKKLQRGDSVSIFYIESNGENGQVGPGFFGKSTGLGTRLTRYSSPTYEQILSDYRTTLIDNIEYLNGVQIKYVTITNDRGSSFFTNEESVESIRNLAPSFFRSQYRLNTESDYETYVLTNFANIIKDVKVVNNTTYLSKQMKYFYDLGISDLNNVSNLLYNQLYFADACNFNNIYMTIVSKTVTDSVNQNELLTASQKELIMSSLRNIKTTTSEVIILDPVFMAVDIVIPKVGITPTIDDIDYSELVIVKDKNSRRDNDSIKLDVYNVFLLYFSRNNSLLGQEIDVSRISSDILSIEGINYFYVNRTDEENVTYNGLSFLIWNDIYRNNGQYIVKNTKLEYFQYPYLYNRDSFMNKIRIESSIVVYENIEY